jgi:hypothetical protein
MSNSYSIDPETIKQYEQYEKDTAQANTVAEAQKRADEEAEVEASAKADRVAEETEARRVARQACLENGGNEESCSISGGRYRRRRSRRSRARKSRRTRRSRK